MNARKSRLKVAFATTARSEYFQMRPLLRLLQQDDRFEPILLVGGAHLSPEHGNSVAGIEADGMPIVARLSTLQPDDSAAASAASAGHTALAFAEALDQHCPDVIFIFGDRYEHLAVALSARCLSIPIAHVHGGEITGGAEDDRYRHAISKLADLHFVSTEVYSARLQQLGEAPDRIFVVGAPFVDLVHEIQPLDRKALETALGRSLPAPLALVGYHPATSANEPPGETMTALLRAAGAACGSIVISSPNHDTGYRAIEATAQSFAAARQNAHYAGYLGALLFQTLMHHADLMIGNSSAGLHEAAYHRLPVINVGQRQSGRLSARHVVDCGTTEAEIGAAIATALAPAFRQALPRTPAAFGAGGTAQRIASVLAERHDLLDRHGEKPFIDLQPVLSATQTWRQAHG